MLALLFAALLAGPSITTTSVPAGIQGVVYSQSFSASGGTLPYQWSLNGGDLPPDVGLNPGGSLAGTPSGSGTYSFTVRVTDGQGETDTKTYSVTIGSASAAPIIKNPSPLVSGNVGMSYSLTFTADGGSVPYAWTAAQATLPPGLSLDSSGKLNGTPTAAGQFAFTIAVTDRLGVNISKDCTITILPPPK